MQWRKTLFELHRDIGFLSAGLVVVYAVSGIAVNHREHWDYNHATTHESHPIGSVGTLIAGVSEQRKEVLTQNGREITREEEPLLVDGISKALGTGLARSHQWRGPGELVLFYGPGDTDVVRYSLDHGRAERTRRSERFMLRAFNALHMNELRSAWTYLADALAVALLFLAGSGVVMVRGRKGLRGRGGALVIAGILVPVAAWLIWTYRQQA